MYDFISKDITESYNILKKISKNLNISSNDLIYEIKDISEKNKYSELKEKNLNLSIDIIKNVFELFIKYYEFFDKNRRNFIMFEISVEHLNKIKTIILEDYYVSVASDSLRIYKKTEYENQDLNKFFIYYNFGKNISLYELKMNYVPEESFIDDVLEISKNVIIVLFCNLLFLFVIENDDLKKVNEFRNLYRLLKCYKLSDNKIIVGTYINLLIFEIKEDFSIQKISIYKWYNKIIENYYFFKNIIIAEHKDKNKDNSKIFEIFSYDKKFNLKKIKKDNIFDKYTIIKICYMKKINKFILLKNNLFNYKLILTDFNEIYDEINISEEVTYMSEYSETYEFILLGLESFSKYTIENNKIKFLFKNEIIKYNILQNHSHILQISENKYFISGMNGHIIYKSNN